MKGGEFMANNSTKSSSLMMVLVAVLLVAGGMIGGYFLGSGSGAKATKPNPAVALTPKQSPEGGSTFYNQVIKAISQSAEGEVADVNGDSVTLKDKGDSLTFTVVSGAKVTRITMPKAVTPAESTNSAQTAPKPPTTEDIALNQVKVGDRVSALLSVTAEGLKAYSLTVFVQEK